MRVIAVDDEPLALKDLIEAIESSEAEVSVRGFSMPKKALSYVERNEVSVAFLDVELGSMDGLTLAKQLLDRQPDMNIVFVTGHSQYAVDAFSLFASGYILKPAEAHEITKVIQNLRKPLAAEGFTPLVVRTFGNFEVFSKGEALHFYRSKSKELLAYLILKRGTSCTLRELCAVLFEDKCYDKSLSSQMQTIISSLIRSLEEVGAKELIIRSFNSLSVDTTRIECDYYQLLEGNPQAKSAFMGEFMSNYSWSESTNAFLTGKL